LREISEFFSTYKSLEKNKWAKVRACKNAIVRGSRRARALTATVKVGGWKATEDTYALVRQSHENWAKKMSELA